LKNIKNIEIITFLRFVTLSSIFFPFFATEKHLKRQETITFASLLTKEIMKRTKDKTEKEENEVVPEERKSKIRLYWENRERIGYPPGKVANMRAILK